MRPRCILVSPVGIGLSLTLMAALANGASLDLAGTWRFGLDPQDGGLAQQWWTETLPDTIELPGVLTAQGYGDPVSMQTQWTGDLRKEWFTDPYYRQYQDPDQFKMPFWLQPERHYVGAAWYQRDISIPEDWQGKRITLLLERPHWGTTVWLDDQRVGSCKSLGTAHVHSLGHDLRPGRHRLTLRVDNRMIVDVGPNSHSVSDHTQGNWNGIAGRIELQATEAIWIEDVQVYPRIADQAIWVNVDLGSLATRPEKMHLQAQVRSRDGKETYASMTLPISNPAKESRVSFLYRLGESCRTWDEFTPVLYDLDLTLRADTPLQQRAVTFGLREVGTQGTQILLNNQAIFLRGTLDCCIFPLTGHPPTDVDYWKRMIRVCKAHGLNHIRFHSWCPPEAAFVAADELGFYYQVECSSWANQGATVGDGRPLDKWVYGEAAAMLKAYGNHPSFMLMAYGNEPGGENQKTYLGKFVRHWKKEDARRLYTSAAGWPLIPQNDFHNAPGPRIQQWGQGLGSIINKEAPRSDYDWSSFVKQHPQTPTVSHEIGQWCVYPNLAEREKYTGLLKAKNFDVFAEALERHGMLHQAHDFLMASGKLQALCYKADIEAALRTPGFGGFQLLDLHDFPGQGTALVGVLDPFWDAKGYITAEEFHAFCAPVVPLARLKKHIYTNGDILEVNLDMAQFGPQDLQDVQPTWTLRDTSGQTWQQGRLQRQSISRGKLSSVGLLRLPLEGFRRATKLTLELSIPDTAIRNQWDLWVYPAAQPEPRTDILVTRTLDRAALRRLQHGGKVLLSPPAQIIRNDEAKPIRMGFSSIFWNTVWTGRQAPHTLGILCDPNLPALAQFPTEYHSNWQWWELVHGAAPFIITEHTELKPLVQVIDDWVTARKLALVFETRVGRGKLIMAGCDLMTQLDQRPVARQMRNSLLRYMASEQFQPSQMLSLEQIKGLLRDPSALAKLGATVSASNHQPSYGPDLVMDQDPSSLWHTAWEPMAPYPHSLILDLKQEVSLRALTCLPRQDMDNGRIARYEIYVSSDGKAWGTPIAQGQWPDSPKLQRVDFAQTHRGRFLKMQALSEVKGRSFASIAEIDIVLGTQDQAPSSAH
jgi:hypothetical protein